MEIYRMTEFTPLASLAGGALIGLAAVLYLALHGRIAGISGISGRMLSTSPGDDRWGAAAFVGGLIAAPISYAAVTGAAIERSMSANLALMALAGLLVGFGAAYGGGCTSGHGVCGIARLSRRSLVAAAVFITVAIATVFVMRHVVAA